MRKVMSFFFVLLVMHATAQEAVPVFVSGKDGYQIYRIPAIITLPGGDLLAFAEGRVHGGADFGNIDIVMKRSRDQGRSWEPMVTLVDNDTLQAGNPAPVVDLMDRRYPQGRVFLFYNTGNNHEGEIRKGNGLREVWYITSSDNGMTWSAPTNITAQVHRPRQPHINARYDFEEDWRSYANTPGHGMQFTSGPYRGRIFIAANHSAGEPRDAFRDYTAHGYYTYDHGETFGLGASVPLPGSNEATATDLSDGSLLMNIRNQSGDVRARIIARSTSGGAEWDSTWFDMSLPDPVCQGSILTVGKKKGKNIIAFSNAADTRDRNNLTLRISYDDGNKWTKNVLVDKAEPGEEKNHTAYSDLVKLSRSRVGILYERKGYSEIVFSAVKWK